MDSITVSEARAHLGVDDPLALQHAIARFSDDLRPGVVRARDAAVRRLARFHAEEARLASMAETERELAARGLVIVAGVDEVGRGALAGPVSAGACVLPLDAVIPGLRDSKTLSPDARERLDVSIRRTAIALAVSHVPAPVIDGIGIAKATRLAMTRAITDLDIPVDHVLVDGTDTALPFPSTAIVRGDSTVRVIAAGAIIAKVARDRLMCELHEQYPEYGFRDHKGYGCATHLRAIHDRGPSEVHRMSFSPCGEHPLFPVE